MIDNQAYRKIIRESKIELSKDLEIAVGRFYNFFEVSIDEYIKKMLTEQRLYSTVDIENFLTREGLLEFIKEDSIKVDGSNRKFYKEEIVYELCKRVSKKCDGIDINYMNNKMGLYDIVINATELHIQMKKEEENDNE